MQPEWWSEKFTMTKIEGVCRDVCEATEFVTIVTTGNDGPHVVGNWGDYMRVLGIKENMIVFPAGRYHQTEKNLRKNNRIQLFVASKKVQGTRSPGQGCLIIGAGEILSSGDIVDVVKAKLPWARGAMVIQVEDVKNQL
jgi:Pyridoxamine 5'-phosphate oxidase